MITFAEIRNAEEPRLILGCEEPELYQHPPQARHLASTLTTLAGKGSQVLVTTHSPLFVSGNAFESVRFVRRDSTSNSSSVIQPFAKSINDELARVTGERPLDHRGSLARIAPILQPTLTEIFFSQRLVLVEGIEDVAYLTSWLALTDRLYDFRRFGCHIVSVDGKSSLLRPIVIARQLQIPVFGVFDCDANCDEKHKAKHEKDNLSLFKLLGTKDGEPFPTQTVWAHTFAAWPTNFGDVVDQELKDALGDDAYDEVRNEAHASYGNAKSLHKNPLLIGAKLALALDKGGRPSSLDKLCDTILDFGER